MFGELPSQISLPLFYLSNTQTLTHTLTHTRRQSLSYSARVFHRGQRARGMRGGKFSSSNVVKDVLKCTSSLTRRQQTLHFTSLTYWGLNTVKLLWRHWNEVKTKTTSWILRPLSVESRASQPARVTSATASTRGTRTAAAYTETTRLWMTRRSYENVQSLIVSTIGIWLVWRHLNFSVTSKGLILTRESSCVHEPLHSNDSMVPLKWVSIQCLLKPLTTQ